MNLEIKKYAEHKNNLYFYIKNEYLVPLNYFLCVEFFFFKTKKWFEYLDFKLCNTSQYHQKANT